MVKDYTFLFKGGKFMDNFEKVEGEKLGEVAGGMPRGMYSVVPVEERICKECGKKYWGSFIDPGYSPVYCRTCCDKVNLKNKVQGRKR